MMTVAGSPSSPREDDLTRPHIQRFAEARLIEMLGEHPAVLVVGPRACGKTTLALRLARDAVRLDTPRVRAAFAADPDAVLASLTARPLLIDEWQEAPEVIGAVKRAVDAGAPPASFILTGSVRAAVDDATWPGTGRVVELTIGPLSEQEVEGRTADPAVLDTVLSGNAVAPGLVAGAPDLPGYLALALRGGFPAPTVGLSEEARRDWYRSYVDEIARRDVRGILTRSDPNRVRTYLEAYALNSAGVPDHRTVFEAAGINRKTADGYEAALERLFVVERIPAWSTNRLAGIVERPKRVMVDAAVLAACAGLTRDAVLRDGDLMGRVLETFVLAQVRAVVAARLPDARVRHLRTEKGRQEVDLVLDVGGGRVVAIEVKATAAPRAEDARHLAWLRDRLGDAFVAGLVLHTGPARFSLGERIDAAPICALWRGG